MMGLYEELDSILTLPQARKLPSRPTLDPEWGGDVLVFAVGQLVETLGEPTVETFFTGIRNEGTREASDLGSVVAGSTLVPIPAVVTESAEYFDAAVEIWEVATAEALLAGGLGNGFSKKDGLFTLYEDIWGLWVSQLQQKYGFSPSEGRFRSAKAELREIMDDVVTSLESTRRKTVVDRQALTSAAKMLGRAKGY